jgi:hypothetical protein
MKHAKNRRVRILTWVVSSCGDKIFYSGPSTSPKVLRKPIPPRSDAGKFQKMPKTRMSAAASSVVRTVKKRKR